MSFSEKVFWWRLGFISFPDFEDFFFEKLAELGINKVAVEYSPEKSDERNFYVWLPSNEWLQHEREGLVNTLKQIAESLNWPISAVKWERIEEEDWSKSWKQYWEPDAVGKNLLILPAWLEPPEELSHRLILRLDPGCAFGTGSHPTTRLCLEALENDPPVNLRVADLGCGSGILSLAALGLGAKEVLAVDIDSLAIRTSLQNQKLNKAFKGNFSAFIGSVDVLMEELKGNPADLLLCNILAPVIEQLAPSFHDLLSPNGRALLSGLLFDQSAGLAKLLNSLGWEVSNCLLKDQWGLLEISQPKRQNQFIS
ncbi:50S ribosomal protein L11 methyltransferase [Prochlorococcus sp. MIT 1307]|uniref:50S ribosomal protein L11 methyltransferase n=1 Tax=Prochlorococcus sp. MIT 1307 TaxID=3096219 RepID=UPI002A747CA9|nr:50S ribosomal protein L11 methyltransferase [Prochlorococcus sp. MIT 1307]